MFLFHSCIPIPTKVMDRSNTFLLEKGRGLYLLLMTQLETSIQPKAWIESRRHTMCFMPKLLTDGQTSHSSPNLSLLSKCRISTTMHQNLQMDHTLLLCQRCLKWVRKTNCYSKIFKEAQMPHSVCKSYHRIIAFMLNILELGRDEKT